MIVRKRLALEYNGSSGVAFVVKSVYSEAHSFSSEANWYIGTIALDHCCSIHGEFFTVNSVGAFVDSHNDDLAIIVDGYGTIVVIINDFSVERFSECADRNHGSPVAVNIWGSIHFEELLVNNILGRANGHGYFMMSSNVNITSVVFEGSAIETIVGSIFNDNNDIYSRRLGSINGDCSFAVGYFIANAINSHFSILIALIVNKCSNNLTTYLSSSTIFLDNLNSYLIVFIDRTFSRIEFEAKSVIRIYNSQFPGLILFILIACSSYGNSSPDQGFVVAFIIFGLELQFAGSSLIVDQGFTISTNDNFLSRYHQTVFINVVCFSIYVLIQCHFVRDINFSNFAGSIPVIPCATIICSHSDFGICNFAKLSYSESSFSIVATLQSNAYNIFTWNEIFFDFSAIIRISIFQGINASIFIPNQFKLISLQIRFRRSAFDANLSTIKFESWFAIDFTSESVFIDICYRELNSVGEDFLTIISPFVATSEDIAAILSDINVIRSSAFHDNFQGVFCFTAGKGDWNISLVSHLERQGDHTILIGSNLYTGSFSIFILVQKLKLIAIFCNGNHCTRNGYTSFTTIFCINIHGIGLDTICIEAGISEV